MKKGENGKNQRIKTIGYFHFSHGIFYMYFLYVFFISNMRFHNTY